MKRFHWDKQYLYWGVTAFLVIAAALVFYLLISNLSWLGEALGRLLEILSPFIWGLVFAYLLFPLLRIYSRSLFTPLFRRLLRKNPRREELTVKLARGFSVFLCILTLAVILAGLLMLVVPQLYSSVERLVVNSSTYIARADEWIQKTLEHHPEVDSTMREAFGDLSDGLVSWARDNLLPEMKGILSDVASNVYNIFRGIYNVIIGVVVSVYVLYDKEGFSARCKKILYCVCSLDAAEQILKGVRFTNQVFMSYLSGKILDSVIVGLICYIGCLLFRIPYAILSSSVVAVSNLIPFFGPVVGAVIATFFILLESPVKALVFVVFVVILQQFDGNVLGPRILGNRVGVRGFWIMFSILLGAGLFGFAGMLLGVPVFVVLYSLLRDLMNRKLARSGLPTDAQIYQETDYFDARTGEAVPKREAETEPPNPFWGHKKRAAAAARKQEETKDDDPSGGAPKT
ncbi:MAG: AI-2E family transporter [Oscillospiraceae bacterium]|nr:AI-2E family transporter [Oscillospiraceae bacterium]MBR3083590.1 AI-2E family transporter [Oscillospiraceae bacterium]MBR3860457.1 AI-2E family transporter [Oscillospiraceae bacterium]MBR6096301.1 AI-2E family transporter [Oscillospiraceae bacterium]